MLRIVFSIFIGLALGIGLGLYLGWEIFPQTYQDSPMPALSPRYRDAYTLLVANGYLADQDALGAIARLRILGVENVPAYIQDITERYITNSREIQDIRVLVRLAEGLGRLTPIMEPYRQANLPSPTS